MNEFNDIQEINQSEIESIDKELEEFLKKQSARVKVIGIGDNGKFSLSMKAANNK